MPQARSSGSRSTSASGRSQAKRSSAAKSSSAKRTTTSKTSGAARKPRASQARSSTSSGSANGAAATDPRLEAVAQRVRKLNEKIIEDSKAAGAATLSSYERALKAIAGTLERGPGKSDIEWIASLATTQAKFIRDVTTAWTEAARGMLK